jgi:hypothetical protein
MAAPSPGAKPNPQAGSFKMPDGFKTLLSFKNATGVGLWIQTIKPGGIDGGDKIPTSTMMNNVWRTFAARSLKTKQDTTFKAAFDPDILNPNAANNIMGVINDDTETITEFYPTGDNQCYYGFCQKMDDPEFKEDEFPVADFTVVATNWDKTAQVEAGPVFTPGGGT